MSTTPLSGILAVCDKYGRMRLLIDSYDEMEKIVSLCLSIQEDTNNVFLKFPYTKFTPPEDGIYGECIIAVKNHVQYWKKLISEKRGKKINIIIKNRKWLMGGNSGISFDLVNLE